MKGRSIIMLFSLCVPFLLASCTVWAPISQSSGSTLHFNMPEDKYKILGIGTGTACQTYIFGFPAGGRQAYQEAVNQAVSSKNGDWLIESTADHRFSYAPFWQEHCVVVQGLVIKLNR